MLASAWRSIRRGCGLRSVALASVAEADEAMLRFCFGLIIRTGAVTFAAIQLADNPGQISIDWLGYHIDTYLGIALLALMALWLLLCLSFAPQHR